MNPNPFYASSWTRAHIPCHDCVTWCALRTLIGSHCRFNTPSPTFVIPGSHRGMTPSAHVRNGVENGSNSFCINTPSPPRQQTSPAMLTKPTDQIPTVVLCPRCHFSLNPRQCYNVNIDFCMPAQPPPPAPTVPDDHAALPSLIRDGNPTPSVSGKERRSSTASTDYFAEFDRLSINTEFIEASLQDEDSYLFQLATKVPASPPTSSPSTESSIIPSTLGEPEPLPTGRRWVVFQGRTPGVYMTS
jgi:hypothetical protein